MWIKRILVDEKYIVETDGKNKGFEQIKDTDNSFIVANGIKMGLKNKLLFGGFILILLI